MAGYSKPVASKQPPPPSDRWGVLSKVLVTLLVIAALLKLDGLLSAGVHPDPWLPSPRAVLAVVVLETLLALWLASGTQKELAWLAAAGFFLFAFVAALSTAWSGVAYCPCFGRMHVSPWLAIVIDFSAITALIFIRPWKQSIASLTSALIRKPRQLSTLGFFVLPALVLLLPQAWIDAEFMARWRGDLIRVSPYRIEAQSGERGTWTTVNVTVKNDSAHSEAIRKGSKLPRFPRVLLLETWLFG